MVKKELLKKFLVPGSKEAAMTCFFFTWRMAIILLDDIQKIYVHGSCAERGAHITSLAQEVSKSLATKS